MIFKGYFRIMLIYLLEYVFSILLYIRGYERYFIISLGMSQFCLIALPVAIFMYPVVI